MSLTKKFLGLFPAYRQAVSNEKTNLKLFQDAREELLRLRVEVGKVNKKPQPVGYGTPTESVLYVAWEDFIAHPAHREEVIDFVDKVRSYALTSLKSIAVSRPLICDKPEEGILIFVFKVREKETLSTAEFIRTTLKLHSVPPEAYSIKSRGGEVTVTFKPSKVLRNLTESPKHWSRQD